MTSQLNKFCAQSILTLLVICLVFSLVLLFNGSNVRNDPWFIALFVAQVWSISLVLKNKTY